MYQEATLPLFPMLPAAGRPAPDAEALRRRAGVDYFDLLVREILNKSEATRLPFDWTINPYRGCEFGCVYCYARSTHGFSESTGPDDFETRIFVKRNAAEKLTPTCARATCAARRSPSAPPPIPTSRRSSHFGVTRSLLEVFTAVEGLNLSITTKSPLVLKDLDLLADLDRKHAIEIHMSITTVDRDLARKLEPAAPEPAARLRAVERLAEAGIAVTVNCMPVMPGSTTATRELSPLFKAAIAAGAVDVHQQALFLNPASRDKFFPWLKADFPHLVGMYQRLYARGDYLDAAAKDQLLVNFRRLRLQHGFPRAQVARA